MRISYDNSTLFSVSSDGTFCVFAIQDKDPKRKDKDLPLIQHSREVLIQRSILNQIKSEIALAEQEIQAHQEIAKLEAASKRMR